MKNALKSGNKILIHCVQGASRSVSLCLGYIIFVKNISYEDALLKAKEIRQICSPNIGFQVQLMWWYKRLYEEFSSLPINPRVFLVGSYDLDQKDNIVAKLLMQGEEFLLDERSIFILYNEEKYFMWIGNKIPKNNQRKYYKIAEEFCSYLKEYERCKEFEKILQGQENEEFWNIWKERVKVDIHRIWDNWLIELNEDLEENEEEYEGDIFQDYEEGNSRDERESQQNDEPKIYINHRSNGISFERASKNHKKRPF